MFCGNPQNKEFCSRDQNGTPVCHAANKVNNSTALLTRMGSEEGGILIKFFDLRDALLQNRMVNFSVGGFCMYPAIRPADRLHIEPKKAKHIKIGEVAVYRRHNLLFAHRTIDKGDEMGRHYIITKPDNTKHCNDGPHFDENIVGVVSSIERKGRILSAEKKPYPALKVLFLEVFFALLRLKCIIMDSCLYLLAFLQQFRVFRAILQLFSLDDKGLKFIMRAPLDNNVNSLFYTDIYHEDLIRINLRRNENSVLKWALSINSGSAAVADLSFVFKPKSCIFAGWWISQPTVTPRYWGTQIEEKIFQKAEELLAELGIGSVFAAVFKKDYLNRMLLRRFGFRETSIYKKSPFFCSHNRTDIKVILEKKLNIDNKERRWYCLQG